MKTVENLAFKGGGVLGAAYAGVYRALQEVKLLGSHTPPGADVPYGLTTVYGNVKRVAGTSAGAIFATMIALGLPAEETEKVLKALNFADFLDIDPKFPENGGLLEGKLFLDWMIDFVYVNLGRIIGVPNPTFGDLAAVIADPERWKVPAGLLKDLHVFARQVSPTRTVEFSAQTTPDVPIAEAVRASMSIPFIFVPWSFEGDLAKQYPGQFFDGGVAFNYPVSAFDSGEADMKTLGFYLVDQSSYQQGLFPELLVHMAMKTLGLSAVAASVIETVMEWVMQARQRGYIVSFDQMDMVKGQLAGAELESAHKVLKAVSDAQQLKLMEMAGSTRTSPANLFKVRGLITDDQHDFYTALEKWYEAVCAVQNLPTNMVFDRDATRTIFIDTLGYIYCDFYLPDWDTENLIESGYACARSYLSFIMYS
jgi:NTE family protein